LMATIALPAGSRMVPTAREPPSFFTLVATRTYSSPLLTKNVAVPPTPSFPSKIKRCVDRLRPPSPPSLGHSPQTHSTPVPINVRYATIQGMGPDRETASQAEVEKRAGRAEGGVGGCGAGD
jgi:hypothetical protein